jgi:hypothetical protein
MTKEMTNDEGNDECRMRGEAIMANDSRRFDLEERTARLGEEIIRFVKALPKNLISEPLIRQLVKSATSVGGNYCEADDACSRKEFRQKNRVLQERIARDKTLASYACCGRTGFR